MASATHVYRNGTILTMDSGGSQAQALAVRGETILAVGSDAEIMALADQHTVVTDLRGRTMLPGFIDGHSHFVSAGLMAATQLDLSSPPVGGVKNIAEIKELIRAKAAETPKGEWILGFGYDDTGLETSATRWPRTLMRSPPSIPCSCATCPATFPLATASRWRRPIIRRIPPTRWAA